MLVLELNLLSPNGIVHGNVHSHSPRLCVPMLAQRRGRQRSIAHVHGIDCPSIHEMERGDHWPALRSARSLQVGRSSRAQSVRPNILTATCGRGRQIVRHDNGMLNGHALQYGLFVGVPSDWIPPAAQ